jgi:hypothetical protein
MLALSTSEACMKIVTSSLSRVFAHRQANKTLGIWVLEMEREERKEMILQNGGKPVEVVDLRERKWKWKWKRNRNWP